MKKTIIYRIMKTDLIKALLKKQQQKPTKQTNKQLPKNKRTNERRRKHDIIEYKSIIFISLNIDILFYFLR